MIIVLYGVSWRLVLNLNICEAKILNNIPIL